MRKLLSLVVAALATLAFVAGPAVADPHPNSCAEPTVIADGDTDGGYLFLCTEDGYFGGSIDSSGNGYLLTDGAEANGDYIGGYIVVTVGPGGPGVGCSDSGDWNEGDDVGCP